MLRPRALVLLAFAGSSIISGTRAAPIIQVFPSPGPSFSSPSFGAYRDNALVGIRGNGIAIGNPATDPTAYRVLTQAPGSDNIISNFNSFLGVANPGPPFNNELGTSKYYGVRILGNGTQFSLSNLLFSLTSTDPGNTFACAAPGTCGPVVFGPFDVYNASREGFLNGVPITSGSATQKVDELVYVGFTVPLDASNRPGATNQAKLNDALAFLNSVAPFDLVATYSLQNAGAVIASGTGTERVVSTVPEPGGFVLLCGGLAGLIHVSRQRRRTN